MRSLEHLALYHLPGRKTIYRAFLRPFLRKEKEDDIMRLPNGYGSVIKLKGKRRKPYAVRTS